MPLNAYTYNDSDWEDIPSSQGYQAGQYGLNTAGLTLSSIGQEEDEWEDIETEEKKESANLVKYGLRGLAEGVTKEFPSMLGGMAQYVGETAAKPVKKAEKEEMADIFYPLQKAVHYPQQIAGKVLAATGKAVKEKAEQIGEKMYGPEPELKAWTPEWAIYEGLKMTGPSIVPQIAFTKGFQLLGGVNKTVKAAKAAQAAGKTAEATKLLSQAKKTASQVNKAVSGAIAAMYGGSQAQEAVDMAAQRAEQLELEGKGEEAEKLRNATFGPLFDGIIEAVGEYFGTKYLGKLMGLDEVAAARRGLWQLVKDFFKTWVVENATEFGQQFGQAITEKVSGIRPEASPIKEAFQVLGPTTVLTLFTLGLSGGANIRRPKQGLQEETDLLEEEKKQQKEATAQVLYAYNNGQLSITDLEDLKSNAPAGHPLIKEIDKLLAEVKATTEPIDLGEPVSRPIMTARAKAKRALDNLIRGEGKGLREEGLAVEATDRVSDLAAKKLMGQKISTKGLTEKEKKQLKELTAEISEKETAPSGIAEVGERVEERQKQKDFTTQALKNEKLKDLAGKILLGEAVDLKGLSPQETEQLNLLVNNETLLEEGWEDITDAESIRTHERQILRGKEGELGGQAPEGQYVEGYEGQIIRQRPAKGGAYPQQQKPGEPGRPGQRLEEETALDEAIAGEAETEPTEAQIEAGNYKKAHINVQGLDISIENPKGSTRTGISRKRKRWESVLKHHYGYIRRTEDKDGDQVDVFVGPDMESENVYVINQIDPATGDFDEHKVMLGFPTEKQARVGYLANYERGWKGLGSIQAMTMDEFKTWLKEGDQTKEIAEEKPEEFEKKKILGEVEEEPWKTNTKLEPRTYQETYPEKTVHEDWDKANSPRYILESAGDVLREIQKEHPDPGYISEKINRVLKNMDDMEGINHPDDSLEAARKYEPEKLFRLISQYESQPTNTDNQKRAKDAILSLMKGDFQKAKNLYSDIEKSFLVKAPKTPEEKAKAKEPWEMTKAEYFAKGIERFPSDSAKNHKALIQQALSEGKPVPEEVLAEYPELKEEAESAKVEPVEKERGKAKIPTAETPKPEGGNPFKKSVVRDKVYHGTFREFSDFESKAPSINDIRGIGIHFGTIKSARSRINDLQNQLPSITKNVQIKSAYINLKKPLRLNDLGSWDFTTLPEKLIKKRILKASEWNKRYSQYFKDVKDFTNSIALRLPGEGNQLRWDRLRDKIGETAYKKKVKYHSEKIHELGNELDQWIVGKMREKGYDGIVYHNTVELGGDSYIVFEPSQIKSTFELPKPSRPPESGGQAPTKTPEEAKGKVEAKGIEIKKATEEVKYGLAEIKEIKPVKITGQVQLIKNQPYDIHNIRNQRFMYNPKTAEMVLGTGNIDVSSHAEELEKSGARGDYDDFIRGWIGTSKQYKDAIIHFAPPLLRKSFSESPALFDRAMKTLEHFIRNGANSNTILRNIITAGEGRLGNLFPEFALSKGAFKPAPITPDIIQNAFPTAKIKQAGDIFNLTLPNRSQIVVMANTGVIRPDPEQIRIGYGRKAKRGEVAVAAWKQVGTDGLMWLSKYAGQEKTDHEAFHAAMDLVLNNKERASVLKKHGKEENAADAYGKWKAEQEKNTIFQKIKRFFNKILNNFFPNWQTSFEKVRTGEVWERGARGAKGLVKHAYAGPESRTADLTALDIASQMNQRGKSAGEIRRDTGWFLGPDDKWRYEIDDSKAKIKNIKVDSLGIGERHTTLSEIFEHKELFKAYPELKNTLINIMIDKNMQNPGGSFTPGLFDLEPQIDIRGKNIKEAKEHLIHEIQHSIQGIEGFARGGSPKSEKEILQQHFVSASIRFEQAEKIRNSKEFQDEQARYVASKMTHKDLETRNNSPMHKEFYQAMDDLKQRGFDINNSQTRDALRRCDMGVLPDKAFKQYLHLAGEIEARDVATRAEFDEQARMMVTPYATQGIPNKEVIVRFGAKYALAQPDYKELLDQAKSRVTSRLKDERGSISWAKVKSESPFYDDLITVGTHYYNQGHQKYSDFARQMKSSFSEVWEKIRNLIKYIWNDVKTRLKSETGAIEITLGKKRAAPKEKSKEWAEGWIADILDKSRANKDIRDQVVKNMATHKQTGETPMFSDGFTIGDDSTLRQAFDYVQWQVQDRLNSLSRIQKAIEMTRGEETEDEANAYQVEEAMHGAAWANIQDFNRDMVEPLLDQIHESGLSLEEVEEYLYARHAPEANTRFQRLNPDREENEWLSGMKNEDALKILQKYKGNSDIKEIAEMVDTITKATRNTLKKSGLVSAEEIANWEKAYKYYIPLKRKAGTPKRGRGLDIRGKEVHPRLSGSHAPAVNVLTNIVAQHEATLIRTEKVKVGRALLKLATENPNKAVWEVDREEHKAYLKKRKEIDPLTGQSVILNEVTFGRDPMFRFADNVLLVKDENAEEHTIWFNPENVHAMRTVKAMRNLGAPNSMALIRMAATFNRFLAFVNTSGSPEFILSNFIRDVQTAGYNISDTVGKNLRKAMYKDIFKALQGIRKGIAGKDEGNEWVQWYERYRKSGAQTGWTSHYKDIETRRRRLERELRARGGDPFHRSMRGMRYILDLISKENTAVENAVRLSLFRHLIEDIGVTEQNAMSVAKNITVNFNRKGMAGPTINALYLFYNAGIQGSARMITALYRSPSVRRLALGTMAFAGLWDIACRLMMGQDDDDEWKYDKIPEWVKERNIIIPNLLNEGDYFKIPMPWGYNVFHVAGQIAGESLSYRIGIIDKPYEPTKYIMRMVSAAISAFNPLGGEGSIAQIISPTVIDPYIQWKTNENFAGQPLKPEQQPFDVPKPEYQLYWSSCREPSKWISKKLYDVFNEPGEEPGGINVSPEALDLVWDTFTGSLGRTISQTVADPWKLIVGEDIKPSEIPIVRRVYGETSEYYDEMTYYNNLAKIRYAERDIKNLRDQGKDEEAKEVEQKKKYLLNLDTKVDIAKRKIKRFDEKIDQIKGSKLPIRLKNNKIRDEQQKINNEMMRINKLFMTVNQ